MRDRSPRRATQASWEDLFHRLTSWVTRRTRPPIEPEDIAGETVLRALRRFGGGPDEPAPVVWTWMRVTAGHLVVDEVRRNRRRAIVAHPELRLLPAILLTATPNPAANRVVAALHAEASAEGRSLLAMMARGRSNTEMARALGSSVRTVERMRQRLRTRYETFRRTLCE